MAIDVNGNSILTHGAGQTEHWEAFETQKANGSATTEAGAASVVTSWTSSVPGDWIAAGVSIKPAAEDAHWQLDETSGTTADDVLGSNDGTLVNMDPGTDWVDGKLGGGLDFDGDDDYVDIGSDSGIDDIFAGGGTVSAWINADSFGENGQGRIFFKGTGTAGISLGINDSNNYLNFEAGFSGGDGNWVTPNNSITLNEWIHVAVT
ncbi:MAG: hypothetical protein JRH19_20970, partial [Deltaproteobacteria bacterium]|nr:hypothetical protein [Deltaproteobacteria bacterium]